MRRAAVLMLLGLALLCGCVSVKPWEKEQLSRPCMKFGAEAASQGFFEHALITNEQAEGGEGGSGGGCGCR